VKDLDVNFDFRRDSNGRDPDSASPTLRLYHQRLWSKPLPTGVDFILNPGPRTYLIGSFGGKVVNLSSDTISNSMASHRALDHFASNISPTLVEKFRSIGSTIGARILFPSDRVDNKPTINVARGFHSQIRDRFDLTLECVRLLYEQQPSPLSKVLSRHEEFFNLFKTFEGYANFFLLQDLVRDSKVKFFTDQEVPFSRRPAPSNPDEYLVYASRSMEFVANRNARIHSLR
jgi:hypothetical protein